VSPHRHHGVVLPALVVLLGGYLLIHSGLPGATTQPATSAQVKDWIDQADTALVANGTPASDLDPADVALIIQHESGGDPAAVNHTDRNALEGHPSQGLMQTTPGTFDANKLPGHGDITNPVDNIIAGERYALRRYGSLANVPGVRAVHAGLPYVGY
jgi:hypothetical protein